MVLPEFGFVDTAVDSPQNRNHVCQMNTFVSPNNRPGFMTWRRFPREYFDHALKTNSVSGYTGSCFSDWLVFDFDGEDLVNVFDLVRGFIIHLQSSWDIPPEAIRCSFTGNRGFHVALSGKLFDWHPHKDLPFWQKALAERIADGYEIDTSIYDTNRLMRITNTVHEKTGQFKIPLTINEILTTPLEQIIDWSKATRKVPMLDLAFEAPPVCTDTWKGIIQQFQQVLKLDSTLKTPLGYVGGKNCFRQDLHEGEGRDNVAFSLACECRRHGADPELAQWVLELWDSKQADSLGEKVLQQKVSSAFKGKVEAEDLSMNDIYTPAEMFKQYHNYVQMLKTKRVKLGYEAIDNKLRAIAPGEVITIIARSGVGKTAIAQNILRNIARFQRLNSLFISMEQPAAQCAERFAQMSLNCSGEEVEQFTDQGNTEILQTVLEELGDNLLICEKTGLTSKQIPTVLRLAENKLGQPIDVVVIDYLGMLRHNMGRSIYEQVSEAAREMKRMARDEKKVVILLCQVGRGDGQSGGEALSLSSARDSGAIEESADYMIGMYRPYIATPDCDDKVMVQILKNRKGMCLQEEYTFDRKSMRIS